MRARAGRTEDARGVLGVVVLGLGFDEAARVARVTAVVLLLPLLARQLHVARIHDYHVVAHVHVGRVERLVLALSRQGGRA